jgi:hypothetical protein
VNRIARQLSLEKEQWMKRYGKLADDDRKASSFLRKIRKAGGYPEVIYELLYFHLRGDYGIGAGRKSWTSFRARMKAFKSKTGTFLMELEDFSCRAIFSLPPVPEAFLVIAPNNKFAWEIRTDSAAQPWVTEAGAGLRSFLQILDSWLKVGTEVWSKRDFQQRNVVLLLLYVRWILFPQINATVSDKHWSVGDIGYLIELAHRANGSDRYVSGKAVNQILLRFSGRTAERSRTSSHKLARKMWSFADMRTTVLDFVNYSRRSSLRTSTPSLLSFIQEYYFLQLRDVWPPERHAKLS